MAGGEEDQGVEEEVEELEEEEEEDVGDVVDKLMRPESAHRKSMMEEEKYFDEFDDDEEVGSRLLRKFRKCITEFVSWFQFYEYDSPPRRKPRRKKRVCAKGDAICIPSNYSKFDLPNETQTLVNVGIDIKDIPKIDDQEYSITLNAFFVVRWTDERMIIDQDKMRRIFKDDEDLDSWIPVDVSFIKEFWLPDAEILNLKEFKTLDVLSKLEGLWLNRKFEIMYAVATRITFICPMTFNSFPLDIQVCRFQVRRIGFVTMLFRL